MVLQTPFWRHFLFEFSADYLSRCHHLRWPRVSSGMDARESAEHLRNQQKFDMWRKVLEEEYMRSVFRYAGAGRLAGWRKFGLQVWRRDSSSQREREKLGEKGELFCRQEDIFQRQQRRSLEILRRGSWLLVGGAGEIFA